MLINRFRELRTKRKILKISAQSFDGKLGAKLKYVTAGDQMILEICAQFFNSKLGAKLKYLVAGGQVATPFKPLKSPQAGEGGHS